MSLDKTIYERQSFQAPQLEYNNNKDLENELMPFLARS